MKPKFVVFGAAIIGVFVVLPMLLFTLAEAWRTRRYGGRALGDATIDSLSRDNPGVRLDIRWMGPPYFANAREGGWIESMLEERFNVRIEPMFLDGLAYDRRKPLMFMSGTVPDLVWEPSILQVQQNARHGFIVEVPHELLKKHAPHCVAIVNEVAPEAWMNSYVDGRNYGLPFVWSDGIYPPAGVWRLDMLRAVGIERVPGTLDEMRTALVRLRQHSLEVHGERGAIYPMGGFLLPWAHSFSEIFGAFGARPFVWTRNQDGRVEWGGIAEQTRQALALLHDWYSEDLIDPDFAVQGDYAQKLLNGRIAYVFSLGLWQYFDPKGPLSLANRLARLNPEAELEVGKFPVGPNGESGAFCWGPSGNVYCFGRPVLDDPQKLARLLAMLDGMAADEDLFVASKAGERGTHWDWRAPGNGPGSGIQLLPPYDGQAGRLAVLSDYIAGGSFFNASGHRPEMVNRYRSPAEVEFRNKYNNPRFGRPGLFSKTDVVPSAARYMEDLRNLQLKYFAEFIRGERPLAEFDRFVADWQRGGGAQLTEEANRMYQVQQKLVSRMKTPEPTSQPEDGKE